MANFCYMLVEQKKHHPAETSAEQRHSFCIGEDTRGGGSLATWSDERNAFTQQGCYRKQGRTRQIFVIVLCPDIRYTYECSTITVLRYSPCAVCGYPRQETQNSRRCLTEDLRWA